jgi:hypothetical protein
VPAINYCSNPNCEMHLYRVEVDPELWLYEGELIVCGLCMMPVAIENEELIERRAAPEDLWLNRAVSDE